MTGNVTKLAVHTKLDLEPETVIAAAADIGMNSVVIVGFDSVGDFYFAGSSANAGTTILLLEMAKRVLLDSCP